MLGILNRWFKRPQVMSDREVIMNVPKDIRDASHNLQNAVMRAQYHIRKAERSLDPIESIIKDMREEKNDPNHSS